jgi:4-hydroxybenzoate polyprenyltransferase
VATSVIAYVAAMAPDGGGAVATSTPPDAATTAVRLGLAMLAFQASIGAINDLSDIELDRDRKPGKPLPRGVVHPNEAILIGVAGLGIGAGLSAASSMATLAIGLGGAGLGYAYDLGLSRTRWSWLPLAAALPLLPIFAWFGATATLPTALLALIPVGIVAGIGLALANGIADEERDREAGVASAVVSLGRTRAWILHLACLAAVLAVAALIAPRPDPTVGGPAWSLEAWALALGIGAVATLAGIGLAAVTRPAFRERGWELEAIGVALVGVAWLAGLAASRP